jgi:hypothetical protein
LILLYSWLPSGPTVPPPVELQMDLVTTPTHVHVHNQGAADWSSGRLRVKGRYTVALGPVRAGQTVRVPLRQLVTDGGQRFNPATT